MKFLPMMLSTLSVGCNSSNLKRGGQSFAQATLGEPYGDRAYHRKLDRGLAELTQLELFVATQWRKKPVAFAGASRYLAGLS